MKKVMFFMLSIAFTLGVMSSCSEVKVDAKKLEGKWNIIEVDGQEAKAEKQPFIEFKMADGRIHGNAGCNTFNSAITMDAKNHSAFTVKMPISTMMACPDMQTEQLIMRTLDKLAGVKANKDKTKYDLVDKDGKVVMVIQKP
ncbi:heat shock protein HslJ [Parabacteroides sp. PFB2-10]|uniref:META domain-containing protein n=1 Tax=Parabacteroides sp. PFB2-10 TaxID=1742405 RepID=UPI00247303C3|nr:META domain-containing protein [Parabacteroides sp. PFB2-10]MDH6311439.1 heat shock protein HslJ [Parabacteroides sp. PFB2-10]MDL2244308.1 META domain-containing protein [Parabacteroides sp. OttesenSCG-928-J18]